MIHSRVKIKASFRKYLLYTTICLKSDREEKDKKVLLCSEDKQIQSLELVWIYQDLCMISKVGSGKDQQMADPSHYHTRHYPFTLQIQNYRKEYRVTKRFGFSISCSNLRKICHQSGQAAILL